MVVHIWQETEILMIRQALLSDAQKKSKLVIDSCSRGEPVSKVNYQPVQNTPITAYSNTRSEFFGIKASNL
jgi:hypothetical protein